MGLFPAFSPFRQDAQFESDYYPQGGQRVITATKDSLLKFNAVQRDTESGLDNAARTYSSATARFLAPAAKPATKTPIPQALNKVTATANKPLNGLTSSPGSIIGALRGIINQYRQCAHNADNLFGMQRDVLGRFGDAGSWVELLCGLPDLVDVSFTTNTGDCITRGKKLVPTRCSYACRPTGTEVGFALFFPTVAQIKQSCPKATVDCPHFLQADPGFVLFFVAQLVGTQS